MRDRRSGGRRGRRQRGAAGATRASSPMKRGVTPRRRARLPRELAEHAVARPRTSLRRMPMSGFAASVFRAACCTSAVGGVRTRPSRGARARRCLARHLAEGPAVAVIVIARPVTPPAGHQHRQRLREQRGLVLAFDLDRVLQRDQHAVRALRLDGEQHDAIAHAAARLHRRDEAHLVEAVVERRRRVAAESRQPPSRATRRATASGSRARSCRRTGSRARRARRRRGSTAGRRCNRRTRRSSAGRRRASPTCRSRGPRTRRASPSCKRSMPCDSFRRRFTAGGACGLRRVGSRKCDSAGISTSAPIMFHTNMNVSRMPMSAWNLIGENAQVIDARGERDADQRDDLARELDGLLVRLGQRDARALLRELHRKQVQRVVDADADAERDHRQRRHLDADAERDHQRFAQDRRERQRHDGDDHRPPAAERDEAQHDHRGVDVEEHRAVGLLDDDVRGGLDAGAAGGEQELAVLVVVLGGELAPPPAPRGRASRPCDRRDTRSPASPSTRY